MALKVGELYGELRMDDNQFQRSLDRAEGGFRGLIRTVTSSVSRISALIGGVASAAIVKMGIDFNASMEQAEIGFKTMLKSGEKAEKFLEDLQEFAAKTPFEFPELRDAASRMVAFGFAAEDVIPSLRAVGDAVAATGGGQDAIDSIIMSLGQMKTVGRASWEEIRQIAERGVPALQYLAEEFGMTQEQVMDKLSKGQIKAQEAIDAIIKGMNEDFGGMMKNTEKTWTGMISNIRDGAQRLIGEAFKPIFNWTRDNVLPAIQDLIARLEKGFEADGFRGALMAIIPEGIAEKIKEIGDAINTIKILAEDGNWQEIGQRLGEGLRTAIANIGGMGQSIADSLLKSMDEIDWAAVGKASVSVAIGFVLGFVDGLFDPVVWFDIVSKNWDTILMIVLGIIFAPARWIAGIARFLSRIPLVGKLLAWLLTKIKEVGIKAAQPIIDTALTWGKELINGFVKGLGLRGPTIWPKIKEVVGKAIDRIKDFGVEIFARGGDLMNRLGQAIAQKGPAQVVRALQKVKDRMSSFLGRLARNAWNWGANLISELRNGITARVDSLIARVRNIAGRIKAYIGFESPTEEGPGRTAHRWAPNLMKMYAEGIRKGIPMIQAATGSVAEVLASMNRTIQPPAIQRPGIVNGVGGRDGSSGTITAPIEIVVQLDGRQIMPTIRRELTLDLDAALRGVR